MARSGSSRLCTHIGTVSKDIEKRVMSQYSNDASASWFAQIRSLYAGEELLLVQQSRLWTVGTTVYNSTNKPYYAYQGIYFGYDWFDSPPVPITQTIITEDD